MKKPLALDSLILTIRGQKVLLDADLAAIYEVETKRLNEQVKRNAARFPADFMFQLSRDETADLQDSRSQIATLSATPPRKTGDEPNRSQIATGSQRHRDPRFLPYAFTEHGAIMAATVLNSPAAVTMSVFVVRAFVRMREHLAANAAILQRLAEIDKTLLEHDQALGLIWQQLQPLLQPPPEPPPRRIGFRPDES